MNTRLFPLILLALLLHGLQGCARWEVYEHAPTTALDSALSVASLAEVESHRIEGVVVAPNFRMFSADFSPSRVGLRFYADAPSSLWISKATLRSKSGATASVEVNRRVTLEKPVHRAPGVMWGAIELFSEDTLDFPTMRKQDDLTLHLWVGGTEEEPALSELQFSITRRVERGIAWPT